MRTQQIARITDKLDLARALDTRTEIDAVVLPSNYSPTGDRGKIVFRTPGRGPTPHALTARAKKLVAALQAAGWIGECKRDNVRSDMKGTLFVAAFVR